MVDADRGRLFKWNLDTRTMTDLGSVPPGGMINTDGSRGYAVWDSTARTLIVMHYDITKGIYLYHPDESPPRWEKAEFPTEGHAGPVHWRSATYDAVNNVIIALGVADGWNSPGLWVLRLTDTSTSTPSDTTLPTVSITAPTSGATVSGSSVAVSANASDNIGIVGVQFKLDGANLGAEDTTSPYSITWNTTSASNGSHALTAVARDAAGNIGTSGSINVTVSNIGVTTPTVTLSASPTTITSGGSATLTWSSTNATTCTASGAWSGTKAISGTQVVSPTVTSTYTLTCTGTGGSVVQSTTVTFTTVPPSTKFNINDRVQTTAVLNVRSTPSLSGALLGTQTLGALGTVIGGPTYADGYHWWQINYDSGVDGWSVENYLATIL
jgi:hypothetical protein